jgi:oligopeptide/dipeptide ABC transporter ATP-binding protein
MPSLLEVRNLKTHFETPEGTVLAVDGVSYDVRKGEILALVGESGCGKSACALSIMGLIPCPPGRVTAEKISFNGRNLLTLDQEAMRQLRGKEIAMVFQEPMTSLNPMLTIGRQITESLEVHLNVGKAAAQKRAIEVLRMVAIADPERRLTQYPHELSGGMRQRVIIAIALVCNPKLILADEPTTALDVTIQAQILELLKKITLSTHVAMILITHNLGIVARYADRVNIMYAGRIVETATATDIFKYPAHPYTLGLLRSVPRLDQPRKQKLNPIEGQPPDLIELSPGCKFLPRCGFSEEKCQRETPSLLAIGDQHGSACWIAQTVRERVRDEADHGQ